MAMDTEKITSETTAEIKNNGNRKSNRFAIVAIAVIAFAIAFFAISINPWCATGPFSKTVDSKLKEEVFWPKKNEFNTIGKNQVSMTKLYKDCVDLAIPLECGDEEYGSKIFSKNYFNRMNEMLQGRLDLLDTEYAIGYIGNVSEYSYGMGISENTEIKDGATKISNETDEKPINDETVENPIDDEETVKPKVVIRIGLGNINWEAITLIFSGHNQSAVYRRENPDESSNYDEGGYFDISSYFEGTSYSKVSYYSNGYDSVDTVASLANEKLVMIPNSELSFDEGDEILLAIDKQLIYAGKVSEGQFVFDESYIDSDEKIHDGKILQLIKKFMAKDVIFGVKNTDDIDIMPVGVSDKDFEWGLKYPLVEIQKENIRKTLNGILADTDSISVKNRYSDEYLYNEIRITLNRESDSPKDAANNVYQVLIHAISAGVINGKDKLYVTQVNPEDSNYFVRLIAGPDYLEDVNSINIITRGDEFNDISDSLADIILQDKSLNEYKIDFRKITNNPDNSDEYKEAGSGTIREIDKAEKN